MIRNYHFYPLLFSDARAEGIITSKIALLRYISSQSPGVFTMSSPTENTTFDQTRLDKIRALQEKGHIIFPTSFDRQHTVGEIKTTYADIAHEKSAEPVTTAGQDLHCPQPRQDPLCRPRGRDRQDPALYPEE